MLNINRKSRFAVAASGPRDPDLPSVDNAPRTPEEGLAYVEALKAEFAHRFEAADDLKHKAKIAELRKRDLEARRQRGEGTLETRLAERELMSQHFKYSAEAWRREASARRDRAARALSAAPPWLALRDEIRAEVARLADCLAGVETVIQFLTSPLAFPHEDLREAERLDAKAGPLELMHRVWVEEDARKLHDWLPDPQHRTPFRPEEATLPYIQAVQAFADESSPNGQAFQAWEREEHARLVAFNRRKRRAFDLNITLEDLSVLEEYERTTAGPDPQEAVS